MADLRKHSNTSNIIRVVLKHATTGAPLPGLTEASAGLIIGTIADNEAATTRYRASSSEVETIATLGTFSAPTASKCRFKEVDATNHPGLYEIQLADARFAVANARRLVVSLSGATNLLATDYEIRFLAFDPQDAVRLGLTALPNAAADAAGGLPISDAGGLDLDAKLANTNEVTAARMGALTDWINGGRLDLLLDSVITEQGITNDLVDDLETRLPATLSELSAVPSATPTIAAALMFLFMALRNKITTNTSDAAQKLYKDDGTAFATAAISDDGNEFVKNEYA